MMNTPIINHTFLKKLFVILLACLAVSCSKMGVKEIRFEEGHKIMLVGGSALLRYTVYPETAGEAEIEWRSSVPDVAYVLEGFIFAKSAGFTTITASCGHAYAELEVEVQDVYVKKASFSVSTLEVPAGGTASFELTSITPDYANATNIRFDINPGDREYFQVTNVVENTIEVSCSDNTPNGKKVTLYCSGLGDNSLADITLVAANRPLVSIGIKADASTVYKGSSVNLSATTNPASPTKNVSFEWSVADSKIASLTPEGANCKLTAISEGTTTVTLKETNSGKTAECYITVKPPRNIASLDLGLYAKCKENSDGSYSVSGLNEFPTDIVPDGHSVEMYLGLSDGYALCPNDCKASDIALTYTGNPYYKYSKPEAVDNSHPFVIPIKIKKRGDQCSYTAKFKGKTVTSPTFTAVVKSITMSYSRTKDFAVSYKKTVTPGATIYHPLGSDNDYATFYINSGDDFNPAGSTGSDYLTYGWCSANAWYYNLKSYSDRFPLTEGIITIYATWTYSGWYSFDLQDDPDIKWDLKLN